MEREAGGPENNQAWSGPTTGGRQELLLAEEVRYIQRRATERAGRFVTIGPLALFSTDAWKGNYHIEGVAFS